MSETQKDDSMPSAFAAMLRAANDEPSSDVLRRLGRHLLIKKPIVDLGRFEDPYEPVTSLEQDAEIDFQLADASPEHRLFDEDSKFENFQRAWPEGIDYVIFNRGESDENLGADLTAAFLERAKANSIPVESPANCSDEELEELLTRDFTDYIRRWRARVIEFLT